jgi:hypothetical protein
VVERAAVNRHVVGSNPTAGANLPERNLPRFSMPRRNGAASA